MTPRSERVSNEALRLRFLKLRDCDGLTYAEIARRLGWFTPSGGPDRAKVMEVLGLTKPRQTVTYEQAEALAQALGLDPFEAGI